MGKIFDVAPPLTWLVLLAAATFLLAGFVLLSHSLVRRQAHGDELSGPLHPGRLEWTFRGGTGCLLTGGALWAWELAAPGWALGVLIAGAAVAFGLEATARVMADG
jgi:hypothetical protein